MKSKKNDGHPLIINGEEVLKEITDYHQSGGPIDESKKWYRTLEESKEILSEDLSHINEYFIKENDMKSYSEKFIEVDFNEVFIAKTYQVKSLYKNSNLKLVASSEIIDESGKIGKKEILRGTLDNIKTLQNLIKDSKTKIINKEIRRIDRIQVPETVVNTIELNNLYELIFYKVQNKDELKKKINTILEISDESVHQNSITWKWIEEESLYLNAKLSDEQIKRISSFNPLRSVQSFTNLNIKKVEKSPNNFEVLDINDNDLPIVGMIDGGVKDELPFFKNVFTGMEVNEKSSNLLENHGSSVASVILYGDLSNYKNNKCKPEFKVLNIRGLPAKQDEEFNLIELEKIITEAVKTYTTIKVWNLSIGPPGPIIDEIISSLTFTLDKLSYENDVLFIVACGNTGEKVGLNSRIQVPGDTVNNITVNSYYLDSENKRKSAYYNSIGPGREGAKLKPDIRDYGGIDMSPIVTFSNEEFFLNHQVGTSFAAPMVTRKLGRLLHEYSELSTLEARALLEHSMAEKIEERDIPLESKGEFDDIDSLITSKNNNEIKILFSGNISAKSYAILKIPLPEIISSKYISFNWTIALKTPVNHEMSDKYTEFGIEDDFFSNSKKYKYTNKKGKSRTINENDEKSNVEIQQLLNNGYTKSKFPSKENSNYYLESERKAKELKWDTVKSQKLNKKANKVFEPFLRIHGLSRSDRRDKINYAIVMTIKLKDDIDIFNDVMNKYEELLPIKINTRVKV